MDTPSIEIAEDEKSPCCQAFTTYMEIGTDDEGEVMWGLCCKECYAEVETAW